MYFSLHRHFFILLAPLFFLLSGASAAFAVDAKVTQIRHWSNPNYTRIVIDLDKKTSYAQRLLNQDPSINVQWQRLLVDIGDAGLSADLPKSIPINDGLLKMARAGQFDRSTVRVVLDIESIEDYKVFPLSDPFRIVIDVTGKAVHDKEPANEKDAKSSGLTPPVPIVPPAPLGAPLPPAPATGRFTGVKIKKIVIDPGHGGKDPGAIGKNGLQEKDVTLKLGKMLRERLREKFESTKLIMTRDTDVFIPLEERTAIANREDADLFVSLHINASPRRAASGIETYLLNVANDDESRRVAARENATTKKAVNDLEFILNDLIKTAKTNDSVRLATAVQDNLVASVREKWKDVKSHGVKGAPFYVLVGTKMPSILVETSFISNPEEEERLRDDKYLEHVVEGILSGILAYINGDGSV